MSATTTTTDGGTDTGRFADAMEAARGAARYEPHPDDEPVRLSASHD